MDLPVAPSGSRFKLMQTYLAYGLKIQSALPLLEFLPAGNRLDPADVTLDVLSNPELFHQVDQTTPPEKDWTLTVSRTTATVFIRDSGLFEITEGRHIAITLAPEADEGLLRLYVGGVIMAILLYQRSCLVLHASAVIMAGQVVAFLGMSGAGKSSLAVALEKAGYPIITDDVLALQLGRNTVLAAPGYPQVKLTKESATTLGHDLDSLLPLHQAEIKLGYRLKSTFPTQALPLQALYFLGVGEALAITPQPPQTSLLELIPHSAPTRWRLPGDGQHLAQCAQLAQQIPMFCLQRPRDLSRLEESARLVEQHVLQAMCAPAC